MTAPMQVVIVGAGPAGVIAAETIRKHAPLDTITLVGEAELKPQEIEVPGDPSSAAFFVVAALLVPGVVVPWSAVPALSIPPAKV